MLFPPNRNIYSALFSVYPLLLYFHLLQYVMKNLISYKTFWHRSPSPLSLLLWDKKAIHSYMIASGQSHCIKVLQWAIYNFYQNNVHKLHFGSAQNCAIKKLKVYETKIFIFNINYVQSINRNPMLLQNSVFLHIVSTLEYIPLLNRISSKNSVY